MKTKIETKRNQRWLSFAQLLPALVLALTTAARAGTPPAAIPFSDIGTKATADYQGDALGITATADGARLRCGFQKLEGRATREGLWLESTEPGAAGKLRLVATTLRREDHSTLNIQPSTTLHATGTVSVEDKLVRFTRPGVTEEYSVSVDGVRQDFVILAPPAGAGDLRVELALNGARAEATADGAKLRLEGSGRELAYNRLRVTDATGRELTARLEVLSTDRLAVSVADDGAVYPVRIDPTFSDADWASLGSGMNDAVYALAVMGTNLYAAGYFTTADGVSANYIAKWNGNTWSALGSRMNGSVRALAVSGTNLYAGGYFTSPGNNIAKWNGTTWSGLWFGLNKGVYALVVDGTDLYVGGEFTTADGASANRVAKWDGNTWSALGSGMGLEVYALAVSGTNLYAGGRFTTAGGVPASGIAKWDGSTWSALGSGVKASVGATVHALAVSGTNLYAGGYFTNAGGVSANNIAKWDGNTWSALGSGMNKDVRVLAVSGTDLYAGGYFTNAGGVSAKSIAKWNGSTWSALGSGVNSGVYALAADGAGHLFVGGYFTVAGTNASPYIARANLGKSIAILEQPQSQIAGIGATVQLAVSASSALMLEYQWFFNETNAIGGATNAVLQLTDVQLSDSGPYTVVVTNVFLAVTSAPAVLTVVDAPAIQSAPTDRTVPLGAAVNFSVGAVGVSPCFYQWFFNGTNAVSGGTNSVLQLTNVQYSDSGPYTVVVTNAYGAVTSPPAILQVLYPSVISCTEAALRDATARGEWVTFASDGTITLNDTIVIETNTVIDGTGHQVTISGGNAVRVFRVNANVSLTLVNLTIANGRSTNNGGGIYIAGGTANLTSCTLFDNVAAGLNGNGGGIYIAGGTVTLTRCNFLYNVAAGRDGVGSYGQPFAGSDGNGGAIFNAGVLDASWCQFLQNTASAGRGAWGANGSFGGPGEPGGAGGTAKGGAICNFGLMAVVCSSFVSNTVTGGSGGRGGSGTSGPGSFFGGSGGQGGAGGDAFGGALFNAGNADLVNCTVVLNQGSGGNGEGGGAGGSQFQGDVTFYFSGGGGGSGGGGAGGVYSTNGHLALTNCTIVLNSSTGGTGGAGGYGGRSGEYSGSTGASGVAEGCIAIHDVYATLVNTLLGANSPVNCSGIVLDAGHNLSSDGSCAFTNVGSMNNTDPGLGPLADNGGPTLTMALLPGSPAIDAGDNAAAPPTDQRGVPRPFGSAADIGAFEFWASPPTSPTLQIGRCEGGGIDMLVCEGPIGQSCQLLTSTDLVNWTAIATNLIITTNGTLLFHESSTCEKQRFYRVTILP